MINSKKIGIKGKFKIYETIHTKNMQNIQEKYWKKVQKLFYHLYFIRSIENDKIEHICISNR